MKYVSTLALIAFLLSAASFADEKPLRLRVLSYNIHHGAGVDKKLDLERIAGVIKSVDPDLVGLQEVDRNTERTGKVDQVAKLAEFTKMHAAFGGNLKLQGGDYGNAVLSKAPIKRHENHKLPQFDEGEPRGVLETEFELPDGRGKVFFLNTHFDHRGPERERLASAELLVKWSTTHADHPAILLGDLNATPESKTLETLRTAWNSANKEPAPTVPVTKPTQQIDHILFAPANRWKVIELKVLDEAIASDHRAIFAELELQPSK